MTDVPKKTYNKKFIFKLKFKGRDGKNTVVNDLSYPGYLDAVYPYMKSFHTEVVFYGPTRPEGTTIACIVRAQVEVDFGDGNKTFTSYGEAMAPGDAPAPSIVRYAETRAKKRALATALNLSQYDFNAGEDVIDEEYGTPLAEISEKKKFEYPDELSDEVKTNDSKNVGKSW